MKRCVFLDRDGVINRSAAPGEYIRCWHEFELFPGIVDWILLFNSLGFLVIVITNQRGVARGLMQVGDVEDIHRRMIEQLAERGAYINDVFFCPHEEGLCECRKPKPGMILEAQRKWNIDLTASLMIGDSECDHELATNCGMAFVRVREGYVDEIFGASDPKLLQGLV